MMELGGQDTGRIMQAAKCKNCTFLPNIGLIGSHTLMGAALF